MEGFLIVSKIKLLLFLQYYGYICCFVFATEISILIYSQLFLFAC